MKHTWPGALAALPKIRPLVRQLALLGALALVGAACDDDAVPASFGRDTRLEWPVDSGGFTTADGGAPESGSHASGDAHPHDSADAHGSGDATTAADGHTHETGDAHGDDDAAGLDTSGD